MCIGLDPCYWESENEHYDNNETMCEFIDVHLDRLGLELIDHDGSYAKVKKGGQEFRAQARGNGDCYNHVVEFEPL